MCVSVSPIRPRHDLVQQAPEHKEEEKEGKGQTRSKGSQEEEEEAGDGNHGRKVRDP